MKKTNILYWTFTILFALAMIISAIPNVLVTETSKQIFKGLGYPEYLIPFIGVAKTLGVIVILIPGFPRLKEWAYAGLFIDLAGVCYSIAMIGGTPFIGWVIMGAHVALGALSYIFYHKRNEQRIAARSGSNVLSKAVA